MKLANCLAAFKRMKRKLIPICKKYKITVFRLCLDALKDFIIYGVTPNEYVGFGFYAKSKFEKRTFYTARHTNKYEKKLNDSSFSNIFWDKKQFNITFSDFINRDWIYVPDSTLEQFEEFIKNHKKIIVKPMGGSSGSGIHIYNGESYDELKSTYSMLEEFVTQSSKISTLNPSSVNTVRIYTIIDSNNTPHILRASMRVGGAGSAVDNYHSGGVAYPIDVESGIIFSPGTDINGCLHILHPATNQKVVGFEIPNWQDLKQFCFKACKVIPRARLVAWDIAVLENGFEMIEGNYEGDPGVMQAPSKNGCFFEIRKYS